MIDFAALPPEINSARMYSGAGSSSLLEAASGWDSLASDLAESAARYGSVITGLDGIWSGPSRLRMSTSATRYLSWLQTTALSARSSGMLARSAAEAFQTAHAATVAPTVVAANRAQLAVLVATNFLGVNSAAIAANEALYTEFWAQDAAAMLAYSAQSAAATAALPQFGAAPQTTSGSAPQGITQAAAASNPILEFLQILIPGYTVGQPLQNLAYLLSSPLGLAVVSSGGLIGTVSTDPLGLLGAFLGLLGAATGSQAAASVAASAATPWIPMMTSAPASVGSVTAVSGSGNTIGGMSVPPSWAQPQQSDTPRFRPIRSSDRYQTAIPAVPFMPVTNTGNNTRNTTGNTPKYGKPPVVMPAHPWGG